MSLLLLPRSLQVNSAGVPYGGAKLYVYRAGTFIDLPVYTTASFAVAHSQPVQADAAGLFPAIYVDPSLGFDVRVILKTSAEVVIYDEDGIPRSSNVLGDTTVTGTLAVSERTTSAGFTSTDTVVISEPHPRLYLTETDAASGKKSWCLEVDGAVLTLSTVTDGLATGKNILKVSRGTGTAITQIEIGDSTAPANIQINGTDYIDSGNFTGTLTGFGSTVQGSFSYRIFAAGNMCVVFRQGFDGNLTGTSNDTTLALTGLPAAIRPSVKLDPTLIPCNGIMDNGNAVSGAASITHAGVATFLIAANPYAVFTNSGTKGLIGGFTMIYPLS